ncbi:hypothetical protein [Scytonema sp. PCC 10023]|uniref:hypothetical protein n=1 Tax=Scytonema sp. PCC 10023 TaxID=1680591 RepID=UPI0039C74CC7
MSTITLKRLFHVDLPHTPFGFASSLRRETRLQDWTHQSPGSGNPPAALAPLNPLPKASGRGGFGVSQSRGGVKQLRGGKHKAVM